MTSTLKRKFSSIFILTASVLSIYAQPKLTGTGVFDDFSTGKTTTFENPLKIWYKPNVPLGDAKGIFPGRVAWGHNNKIASWDGKTGFWWDDPDNIGKRLSSLGVTEHWNNAIDKKYSRNLSTGNGIELIYTYIQY